MTPKDKDKDKDHESEETEAQDTAQEEPRGKDREFLDEEAAAAEAQSPAEPQTVPERRPQAFLSPTGGDSEAGKRAAKLTEAMGPEAYERAKVDEKHHGGEGRLPRLYPGQRVQILADHPEAGRMAYIQAPIFDDAIQELIGNSGSSEARFATVDSYVVRTRDGRSDVLVVPSEDLTPLEVHQGWGRGQI
jgi:hypothetical protein